MVQTTESQAGSSYSTVLKGAQPFIFLIDYDDFQGTHPEVSPGKVRRSIVIRIESEDISFSLSATEPEGATGALAEALAYQIALSAIEKDFPTDVNVSLSAKLIDSIPTEFENRLPSFCMNGNHAWLVNPPKVRPNFSTRQPSRSSQDL
jgi:hypothetical protein